MASCYVPPITARHWRSMCADLLPSTHTNKFTEEKVNEAVSLYLEAFENEAVDTRESHAYLMDFLRDGPYSLAPLKPTVLSTVLLEFDAAGSGEGYEEEELTLESALAQSSEWCLNSNNSSAALDAIVRWWTDEDAMSEEEQQENWDEVWGAVVVLQQYEIMRAALCNSEEISVISGDGVKEIWCWLQEKTHAHEAHALRKRAMRAYENTLVPRAVVGRELKKTDPAEWTAMKAINELAKKQYHDIEYDARGWTLERVNEVALHSELPILARLKKLDESLQKCPWYLNVSCLVLFCDVVKVEQHREISVKTQHQIERMNEGDFFADTRQTKGADGKEMLVDAHLYVYQDSEHVWGPYDTAPEAISAWTKVFRVEM